MALQFDMSKDSWKQDYLMQQAQNQGVSPSRQLGENLGAATGAVGGALGKAILPRGGQNLMANRPNWFKETSSGYQEAKKKWEKKESDAWENRERDPGTAGSTVLEQMYDSVNPNQTRYYDDTKKGRNQFKKDYIAANPDYLSERPVGKDYNSKYKFTPFKGLLPKGGQGIVDFFNKGAEGVKDTAKEVYGDSKKLYEGGREALSNASRRVKRAGDTAVDLLVGDKDMLDQFEGPQDSPLIKALKQRKLKKANKAERDAASFTPSPEMSDIDFVGGELPVDVEFGLAGNPKYEQLPENQLQDLGNFEAPVPRFHDKNITQPVSAAFQNRMRPNRFYSPREQAAKQALLLQNYGPLQSILEQEKLNQIQEQKQKMQQEQYADPMLDTTNMLQGVDTSGVQALPAPQFFNNPFRRGMK